MNTAGLAYPRVPDINGIIYVAITVFIMAYSFLFNIFPILIFFAIWLPHALYKKTFTLRPSRDLFLVILLPLLACYSAFWSDYPVKSLYTGLEYLAMAACTLIMSRIVSPEAFVKGITLGASVVLGATILNGTYSLDYMSGTYSLVGLFGSKNQAGFVAEIGIYSAIMIMFMDGKISQKILFSLIPLLICSATLFLCKSASSLLSLAATLGIGGVAYMISKTSRTIRVLMLAAAVFSIGICMVAVSALNVDVQGGVLTGMGKDSTLTGRTYLWAEGIKIGLDDPVLGHGYSAFWVPGQINAERYWKEFDIGNQSGFHFHNLFIQTFVDLGAVGLSIVCLLLFIACYKSLLLVLRGDMKLELGLALGFSYMFLIRAFVEVDWLGPFGLGPFIFFSIFPRLAALSAKTENIELENRPLADIARRGVL
jgi:exopolysaccharide production protein ExoQ